jgi:hypothetical protein
MRRACERHRADAENDKREQEKPGYVKKRQKPIYIVENIFRKQADFAKSVWQKP